MTSATTGADTAADLELCRHQTSVDVPTTARLYGVSEYTIRAGVKSGSIPTIKTGGRVIRIPSAYVLEQLGIRP